MNAPRRRAQPRRRPAPRRHLVTLVRTLLLFESAMYSAVTPILPHYVHTLHASTPAIGVLVAAYSAGLLPGALLGGWIAARVGVRRTTLVGLVAFGLAVGAFGFATDIVTLDLLRVVQGLFCGLIWGGGLTWVITVTPRERRGAVLGSVIGAATFGTLLGPLLGTAAVAAGTRPVFAAVGAISLALAWWTARHPEPRAVEGIVPRPGALRAQLAAVVRSGGLGLGTWVITLEAITFGAANALLPLRLSRFGASGVAIGATFLLASALSTVLSPTVGRLTDRHGPRLTMAVGLAAGAPLLAVVLVPHGALLLAVVSVIAFGAPLTACMIPAVALMTESAERAGVALVLATTLVNLAYAVGETIGAPAAAGLAQASGDAVPLLLVSALMGATLVGLLRRGRRFSRPPTPPTPPMHGPGVGDQPSTGSSVTSRATSAA